MKSALGIDSRAYVIGIVGRLAPVKGHKYFIDAARIILDMRQDVHFIIVGDGSLRESLESSVPASYSRNITFTGFRNDVKELIDIMDIVVFSSLSEGIPYTLLEAMSMGKAVVATRVGGLVEVISDKENGLFVNAKDAGDIAQKCLSLLEDTAVRRSMGEAAARLIKEKFSADKMKDDTLHVYENSLK
jgi:glycosyltransferase involved in cell wall biosynthesis